MRRAALSTHQAAAATAKAVTRHFPPRGAPPWPSLTAAAMCCAQCGTRVRDDIGISAGGDLEISGGAGAVLSNKMIHFFTSPKHACLTREDGSLVRPMNMLFVLACFCLCVRLDAPETPKAGLPRVCRGVVPLPAQIRHPRSAQSASRHRIEE